MTKILVADDNSNIQKMVGLALKDQGIEVVGVGNGEAAVRKATEMRPDLVLADVFMPVRNGYEVCSYIKGDASLAHIPVILLVGAFDPLDEQEAQRVGADGVLKKPFVPPDPLISMVKSALARAAAAAPPPPPPAPVAAPEPAPTVLLPTPEHTELPDIFAGAPQQVEVPEGSQAMAFGSLLDVAEESPATAPAAAEEDNSFLVARNPGLENQRNWGVPAGAPPSAEAPAEAEPEQDTVGTGGWVPEEESALPHGEVSASPAYESSGFELDTFQNQAAAPPAPAPPPVAPPPVEVETEEDFALEAQASSSNYGAPQEELGAAYEFMAPPSPEIAAAVNASAHGADLGIVEEPAAEASSEESPAGWATEAQPSTPWGDPAATQEAAWDMDPAPEPELEPETSPVDAPLSFTEPAVSAPVASTAPATPAAQPVPAASSADADATVARILEKMSPEMLQTVTRELLKPVIQALVKEELDKKK
ncbi:MAG: response regulator [Acidobacteriia bacterium]|nr:response regulator [Terriglobia bacterium]